MSDSHATMRGSAPYAVVGLLLAAVVWSYWPTLVELREFWAENEDYSVGQLVPLVALYLVWSARRELAVMAWRPAAWGAGVLVASQALRLAGVYYAYASAERLSLVLTLAALVVWIGGVRVARRLFWVLVFLLLMVPLPQRLHNALALPLQQWATALGLFGLELCGFFVQRDGNVLSVNGESSVLVAEACSGLRMLTAFVFTAAVLCFLVTRPAWQKAVLIASSVLIAVISNGVRVLATAVFMHYATSPSAEQRFHDLAGYLMMPLALALLIGELRLLALLTQSPVRVRGARGPEGSVVAAGGRR
jgi:exosortase